MHQAEESLKASKNCLDNGFYKDSINRSYYCLLKYAITSLCRLKSIVPRARTAFIAQKAEYVATEIFPRELGKRLGTLKQLREKSDYDDFYIASKEKSIEQIETAEIVLKKIKGYLTDKL